MERESIFRNWKHIDPADPMSSCNGLLTSEKFECLKSLLKQGKLTVDMFYDVVIGAALGFPEPISVDEEIIREVFPTYGSIQLNIIPPEKLQDEPSVELKAVEPLTVEELPPHLECSTTGLNTIGIPINSDKPTIKLEAEKPQKVEEICTHSESSKTTVVNTIDIQPMKSHKCYSDEPSIKLESAEPVKVEEISPHLECSTTVLNIVGIQSTKLRRCYSHINLKICESSKYKRKIPKQAIIKMLKQNVGIYKQPAEMATECCSSEYYKNSPINMQLGNMEDNKSNSASSCDSTSDSNISTTTAYSSLDDFMN